MSMWQQWTTQCKKVSEVFAGNSQTRYSAAEVKDFLSKIPEEFRGLDMGFDDDYFVSAQSFKEFCRFLPLLKHGGGYALQCVGDEIIVILFSQDHKMRFTFLHSGGFSYTMFTKYGGHSLYRKRIEGELYINDDQDLYIVEKVLKFMLP